jgi:Mg2+-importing ATPase
MEEELISLFSREPEKGVSQKQAADNLLEYSDMLIPEVFQNFGTDEHGLLGSEARERLEKYGPNEITAEQPPSWYYLLYRSYANPFNILVSLLGVIYWFLGDIEGSLIIASMVSLSVGIRFVQELRSLIAAEKLKTMVSTTATVIRRGDRLSPPAKIELPLEELVPGDVVFLSAGDLIPADLFLVSSKELYVNQASLTGEALPVEKYESTFKKAAPKLGLLERPNLCFTGTDVVNGTATAVILATGNSTYFGSMSKSIAGYRPLTSFDIGINSVSWLLIRFMFVMVPIVFLINSVNKGDWFESLLFSLSVAVGLIPEMLPMIVTSNLAKGAVKMASSKVIVKNLNSIQNFGAINVLCTDKTGTLTQNKIILEKYVDLSGNENSKVLEYGYLNSYFQTGLKNIMDLAVLEHGKEFHLDPSFRKVDEIPFDFARRRMSVVLQKRNKHLLICKGAVEELFSVCSLAKSGNEVLPFTEKLKDQMMQLKNALNEDGLRVLAVAYKEIPDGAGREYKVADERELTLMGLLAFLDPPRSTAERAIKELQALSVEVKVLTGDNEAVTRKICHWVGLEITKSLSGEEVDKLTDEELKACVDDTTIFARLTPLQKLRVIQMLKANGHTVGYLGDGINDAPALRAADVGISVDSAVDIAKESADIIMLEKSLLFLKEGIVEGRYTFGNIIKYIKMAVSSNFGNVFSVLGASALLPFLPMLPLQLLIQNLLYDISQISIPFDKVDADFLQKPRKWSAAGIARFMVFIGPISSIFDYTTFAVMWFVFSANTLASQALFQTGWFVEGLLTQTLIVHMLRTQKIPFIQSIASLPLLVTTLTIMAIGIALPYTHLGQSVGLVPLPFPYFYWLFGTLLCYCVLVQLVKAWFIRRYHYWL